MFKTIKKNCTLTKKMHTFFCILLLFVISFFIFYFINLFLSCFIEVPHKIFGELNCNIQHLMHPFDVRQFVEVRVFNLNSYLELIERFDSQLHYMRLTSILEKFSEYSAYMIFLYLVFDIIFNVILLLGLIIISISIFFAVCDISKINFGQQFFNYWTIYLFRVGLIFINFIFLFIFISHVSNVYINKYVDVLKLENLKQEDFEKFTNVQKKKSAETIEKSVMSLNLKEERLSKDGKITVTIGTDQELETPNQIIKISKRESDDNLMKIDAKTVTDNPEKIDKNNSIFYEREFFNFLSLITVQFIEYTLIPFGIFYVFIRKILLLLRNATKIT